MQSFFDEMISVNFNDDLYRNIKTIRKPQHLFDDLSDNPEDWNFAIQADINSKPRCYYANPIIHRPFDEINFIQAIAFPFDPKNWAASRYTNGNYGVWYGTKEFMTSIFETAYHWKRFIKASQFERLNTEIIGERRVYKVRCNALLFDFIKKIKDFPLLIDPKDYSFSQQIGALLQQQGHPGILSQSARCEGIVSAIFTDRVLSDPRDYCFLSYYLNPETQKIRIEREMGKELIVVY